jgi:hypothetical protein
MVGVLRSDVLIDCALVDVKFKKAKSETEPGSFMSRLSL